MKLAGIVVGFLGGWTIATVIVTALASDAVNASMMSLFPMVAPWTGLAAGGILTIVAGFHLYDKGDRR